MYKIIKSKHNETALIAVVLGFVALGFILLVGTTDAFFHENKPEKPTILATNPIITEQFDVLYEKYPNISQQDLNDVHTSASATCFTETEKIVKEDNPEDAGSPLGMLVASSLCQGFMTGMMEDYLDQLGIQYYSTEDANVPTLLE